jgi:ADP-heptose:LPS heptosyltransferase
MNQDGTFSDKLVIVLQCEGLGDCLFAIPIIKKLRLSFPPQTKTTIVTHRPDLFRKCPYVNDVFDISNTAELMKHEKVLILFNASPLSRWLVDTFDFMTIPIGIGELSFREKQLEYFPIEEDRSQHFDMVINTSVTWPSRSWPIDNWQKVADYCLDQGYSIAVVGKDVYSKADNIWKKSLPLRGCTDLTNILSLDQTYYTIKNCGLFITCQNGLSVLSGATNTEIIVLDMSIDWSKCAMYRKEDPHYKVTYVKGNCILYCCQSWKCPVYGEFRCIPTVEQVLEVVKKKFESLQKRSRKDCTICGGSYLRLPPYGRHESFDLVKEIIMSDPNDKPVILELGMTRTYGNWLGDGYSTPFFSYMVNVKGGELFSVDIDPEARIACEHILKEYNLYTDRVHLYVEDAIRFLQRWNRDIGSPIDLLYLDAWDYAEGEGAKNSEEKHLEAFKIIENYLSERALILIDDIHDTKTFKGKGRLVIPYLMERGYKTVYLGYQCLFSK